MYSTRQRRCWGLAAFMGVALITAAALTGAAPAAESVRHRVEITRLTFMPVSLVVAPGDTVVWVNLDLVPHTVTAQDESWSSRMLPANAVWELHITEGMTGKYFCRFHPTMMGQIQVKRS